MKLAQMIAAHEGLARTAATDRTGGSSSLITLLRAVGETPRPGARILDLGCGAGLGVAALVARGFDAHGFDIFEFWREHSQWYWSEGGVGECADRLIAGNETPYRLPYPDASFDYVISSEVLEHVDDRAGVFREVRRVLKPGGISAHIFPSRTKPLVEGHVGVPIAILCKWRPWLKAAAWLGLRTDRQAGMAWRDVLRTNSAQMEVTHYPSRATILGEARSAGFKARFAHRDYVAGSGTGWTRLKRRAGPIADIAAVIALPHMLVLSHAASIPPTEPAR